MKKLDLKEILSPALALFIICLVSAFLLAGTNTLTAENINENNQSSAIESRKIAFTDAASFSEEESLSLESKSVLYACALDTEGNTIGYVFTSTNKGYGGDVTVITAIDNSGTVLKSVVLSMDDETPGLGQNAGKQDFLSRFIGKKGPFSWVKNGGTDNEITGVTSATFTSEAVIACVNDAVAAFNMIGGDL